MSLENTEKNWQQLAQKDPLWAVLSWDSKRNHRWDSAEFFKTGSGEILSVMDYLRQLGLSINNSRALDFGCGVGRLTQGLSQYFDEVVGVDVASAMIKKAQELNYEPNCLFVINTEADLKIFPDNYFSFIYSRLTFQHIEPKYTIGYIKEFIRTLEPGGVALFVQPHKKSISIKLLRGLSIKQLLRVLMPWRLQNIFRNKAGKLFNHPVMELHSISREGVIKELSGLSVEIINIDTFGDLGPAWECLRYCVQKQRS